MDIWSKKWLMSFNPDKTEIMIFSNRSIPENLDFSFNGISPSPLRLNIFRLFVILSLT
jgi:hypothetical protein